MIARTVYMVASTTSDIVFGKITPSDFIIWFSSSLPLLDVYKFGNNSLIDIESIPWHCLVKSV
jgi:hypothetical protein